MEMIKDLVLLGTTKGNNGYKITPTSITIHTTGNKSKGANAKAHANYIKNPSTTVSWHYTVDDICAIQHFEHNIQCWHAGTNAGNTTSIGIEMCVNSDGDFNKTIENTIQLVRKLIAETGIKTIKKHQDWSGKYCPKELLDMGIWDNFVSRCLEGTANNTEQNTSNIDIPKLSNYKGGSIVDGLNSVGYNSSFNSRKELYKKLGYTDTYTGTAVQNTNMLNKLRDNTNSNTYTITYLSNINYKGSSITEALKQIKADSSYTYRSKLASKNGISGYTGTASQNTQMLNKLKQGKLIKA